MLDERDKDPWVKGLERLLDDAKIKGGEYLTETIWMIFPFRFYSSHIDNKTRICIRVLLPNKHTPPPPLSLSPTA
uniref:Uncharacterized protein n=1 Tax=Tanacetum cinerariifolium TaxID=118510 RepID=A0A6L2LWB7_TANCI|nr:hypothetical protein [Tanacetum cinerariifolium]